MRNDPALDTALRGFYKAEPQPAADPNRVFTGLVRAIDHTPQRRRPWQRRPVAPAHERSNHMLAATTAIAVTVAIASVGGFFALGIAGPTPTGVKPAAQATASQRIASPETAVAAAETQDQLPLLEWAPLTATEVEAATPPATRQLHSGETTGHGYTVTIEAETFRHDSRVFSDESASGPVGYTPLIVTVDGPDGTSKTSQFEKPLVASVAVSPAGVLMRTKYGVPSRSVRQLATGRDEVNGCCPMDADGVVRIKKGTKGLKPGLVQPDEYTDKLARIGLTPDDVRAIADSTNLKHRTDYEGYWFSSDGESWTPVRELNELAGDMAAGWRVVGSRSGFFAPSGERLFHSVDGITWSEVPGIRDAWARYTPQFGQPTNPLLAWGDKVATHDGRRWFDASGSSGELLPGVSNEIRMNLRIADTGLFAVDIDEATVLFSPDGRGWSTAPIPDPVLDAIGDLYPHRNRADGDSLIIFDVDGEFGYRASIVDEARE